MNEPRQGPPEQTINTVPAVAAGQAQVASVLPPQAVATPASMRRVLTLNAVILLALILIGLAAFWLWHQGYYFYNTDDAHITGTTVSVAVPSTGTVTRLQAPIGQTVHAGDALATLRAPTGASIVATSPINGTIISEGATLGEVLPAGQPLAQVVDLTTLYLTAYVEENHVGDITVGQGVDVAVDAIKDITFHGRVSRILPATASTFSLLPTTDYASGNFTKVTQRVPVQITLDGYQGHALYPGESANVTIHIHS